MTSYTEQLFQRGMQQGVHQGQEQGERLLLLRQLRRRFTAQKAHAYEAKLMNASSTEIERWAENILDAKTIEDVFA